MSVSVDVMLMVMCKNVAWLFQNALVLPQIIACLETLPLLRIQGCVVGWTLDSCNILFYSASGTWTLIYFLDICEEWSVDQDQEDKENNALHSTPLLAILIFSLVEPLLWTERGGLTAKLQHHPHHRRQANICCLRRCTGEQWLGRGGSWHTQPHHQHVGASSAPAWLT